jgi:hypothetical protein
MELQDEIRGIRGDASAATKKKIDGFRSQLNQNLVKLAMWADQSAPGVVKFCARCWSSRV